MKRWSGGCPGRLSKHDTSLEFFGQAYVGAHFPDGKDAKPFKESKYFETFKKLSPIKSNLSKRNVKALMYLFKKCLFFLKFFPEFYQIYVFISKRAKI